jgi:hypothetical protein
MSRIGKPGHRGGADVLDRGGQRAKGRSQPGRQPLEGAGPASVAVHQPHRPPRQAENGVVRRSFMRRAWRHEDLARQPLAVCWAWVVLACIPVAGRSIWAEFARTGTVPDIPANDTITFLPV